MTERLFPDDHLAPTLPAHGPGCQPTIQASRRFPGEPRYICVASCPRRKALDAIDQRQLRASST